MSEYKYIITIGGHVSEPVDAYNMIAVCRAFGTSPINVAVWKDYDIAHEFDLAAGEDVIDWAEAQWNDISLDGGFEGSEHVLSFLCNILKYR